MVDANTTAAMMEELRQAGLVVDDLILDGEIQRVGTTKKPKGTDGRYGGHADRPANLWWENFHDGTKGKWSAKTDKPLTPAEKEAFKARMVADKAKREAEEALRHKEGAEEAQRLYTAATPCTGHEYLTKKGVNPVPFLKVGTDSFGNQNALIVPLFNEAKEITTLQSIPDAQGGKLFLPGGKKKGSFFPIGGKDVEKSLLVCEGLATGLSLYEAVGFPVLVAFDAGNLLSVAEVARRLYPEREIVLCADYDDPSKGYPAPGGIGVAKATEAAVAVGGSVAIPRHEFPPESAAFLSGLCRG